MMEKCKLCVSSGWQYTDIDALACAVAFTELNECATFLPGALNASVTDSIRKWKLQYSTEFPIDAEQFVIVDTSTPASISPEIPNDKIIMVYDHHTGFEDFWGGRGRIEFIGACATLIYELFGDKIPTTTTANLLSTAIFANTLNFGAAITTDRDIAAYERLKLFTDLPDNWTGQYYSEVEKAILLDVKSAIEKDIKVLANNLAIGQIEMWNSTVLLNNDVFQKTLLEVMSEYDNWLMNMPSIKHGQNYFISKSKNIKDMLSHDLNVKWNNDIGISDKLFLRKEIIKICKIPR